MICLTIDVHQQTLGTGNQKHSDRGELRCAQDFLELCEERKIPFTMFTAGRCLTDQLDEMAPFFNNNLVELGGHTWDCYQPELVHRIYNKLHKIVWGCANFKGPSFYERRDIQKTIDIIEQHSGQKVRCWRNHQYVTGPNTHSLLAKAGVLLCSDDYEPGGQAQVSGGITTVPITILPDHEHLYHAERTVEWVAWWQKRYNRDTPSYFIDEWTKRVIKQIDDSEKRGVTSVLLIHPITMYLCDKYKHLNSLLDRIALADTDQIGNVFLKGAQT